MVAKSGFAPRSPIWLTVLRVLFVIAFLAGSYLLLRQAGQLGDIVKALGDADKIWIAIGLMTTALSYTMASLTQYAAGSWQGSFRRVHLLQWAGNFVNRFLPLNVGSMAMMTRHYQKHGRSPAEALTVATLPSIVGFAKNVIPFLVLSPFTIGHIIARHQLTMPPAWVIPVVFVVVTAAIMLGKKFREKIRRFWLEARKGFQSMKHPWQLSVVILASIAFTLLASTTLFAAVHAVGEHVTLPDIFTLYILSVFAGAILPTPGGIGSTEAALIAGLTSLGITVPAAVSITLLFRLMTFWAPLIPGGIALHIFRKRTRH